MKSSQCLVPLKHPMVATLMINNLVLNINTVHSNFLIITSSGGTSSLTSKEQMVFFEFQLGSHGLNF